MPVLTCIGAMITVVVRLILYVLSSFGYSRKARRALLPLFKRAAAAAVSVSVQYSFPYFELAQSYDCTVRTPIIRAFFIVSRYFQIFRFGTKLWYQGILYRSILPNFEDKNLVSTRFATKSRQIWYHQFTDTKIRP